MDYMNLNQVNRIKNNYEELIFDKETLTNDFKSNIEGKIYFDIVNNFFDENINFLKYDKINSTQIYKKIIFNEDYSQIKPNLKKISEELNLQYLTVLKINNDYSKKLKTDIIKAKYVCLLVNNDIELNMSKLAQITNENKFIKGDCKNYILQLLNSNN